MNRFADFAISVLSFLGWAVVGWATMTLLLAVFGLGYAIVAVGMVIGTWFGHLVVRPFYHVKVRELTLFESGLEIMEGRKALRDYHSRAMRG